MSLRRIVDELVGPDGSRATDAAPGAEASRSALAEAGHGELDPGLYGEALLHYAETAPLEVADALAPVVTEASAVPFDPDLDPNGSTSPADEHDDPADDGQLDGERGDDASDDSDPSALDEPTGDQRTDDDVPDDDVPGDERTGDERTGDGPDDGPADGPASEPDAFGIGSLEAVPNEGDRTIGVDEPGGAAHPSSTDHVDDTNDAATPAEPPLADVEVDEAHWGDVASPDHVDAIDIVDELVVDDPGLLLDDDPLLDD